MKALIVGAGRMGRAAGYDLIRHGVEVTYYDKDHSKLTIDVIDKGAYASGNVHSAEEEIRRIKYDVVLGTAGYGENLELTRACIDAKTHFCDLGGNNDVVKAQLALGDKAEEAGVVIIPDNGLAPGLGPLLAAYGVELLGGEADNASIFVGGLPQNPQPPLNYALSWSVNGLVNEYLEPSKIIRDGKIVAVESLSGIKSFQNEFEMFGNDFEVFHTSGGLSTLAETFLGKVKNLEYKTIRYPGHANIFATLKMCDFFGPEHRSMTESVLQKKIPQIDTLNPDVVYVHVLVEKGDDYVSFDIVDKYDHATNISAMGRTTGFSIAAAAYMLASGSVSSYVKDKYSKNGGVIPGELALPLEEYIGRVKERGIEINMRQFKDGKFVKFGHG